MTGDRKPVEVLEVRRLSGDGNLRAFAKVRIGCLVIHGCRVIQQPGQRAWVALPQVPARAKADGSGAGWYPVVEVTNRSVMDQVRDAVLAAWDEQSERVPLPERGQRAWQ
jgi:DNA-binding cell septation regulator SpoVG